MGEQEDVTPYHTDDAVTLYHGDCIDVMRALPDNSVDAVVTDPPYALNFMGRAWDNFTGTPVGACEECGNDDPPDGYRYCTDCMEALDEAALRDLPMLGHQSQNWNDKATHSRGYADNNNAAFQRWCRIWSIEALRVLKPGGHLLAFGGTRTWHRLAVAIEDAGFEVRDSIAWMYGSGFPKSLDVSKAIDKAAGELQHEGRGMLQSGSGTMTLTPSIKPSDYVKPAPATDAAKHWQGWGTALKPAFEPIVVARKPLIGTVAENVQQYGTGALNIDGCRIGTRENAPQITGAKKTGTTYGIIDSPGGKILDKGRWPANVILDESQAAELDKQSGVTSSAQASMPLPKGHSFAGDTYGGDGASNGESIRGFNDTGGASRFFYTAKATSAERPRVDGVAHPTVKPLDLMRYLVRLVTPPGGTVLEPFAGSGTTAEACIVEGFKCIAIEMTDDYLPLIVQRITKPIEVTLL